MLIGSSTSHKLQAVTSAAADIEAALSVIGVSTASPPVVDGGELLPVYPASITTATTTDLVTGVASKIKRVMECSFRNNHASTACDVTVQRTDGTNTQTIIKVTLLAGEVLLYNGGAWLHYDANGGVYPSVGNAATQAEMEAGASTSKYVTPFMLNYAPGACKAWYRVTVSGGVPTLANQWNISGITDTNTGQLTVTIFNDFSAVNYAICTGVERAATALTVANLRNTAIRNATVAVGSFIQECWDQTATTAAAVDPATWYGAMFGDQ